MVPLPEYIRYLSDLVENHVANMCLADESHSLACSFACLLAREVAKFIDKANATPFSSYFLTSVQLSSHLHHSSEALNLSISEADRHSESRAATVQDMTEMLFEIQQIPGKGKGLVSRVDINKGTRILTESPLFTIQSMPDDVLQQDIATKLKALSKDQQRQFLSLHNNFPGKYVFSGIVKTNALPCGPGSDVGGIYPTICLVNHSCHFNAHSNWNSSTKQETTQAIKDIPAGEEITICYIEGGSAAARQRQLKHVFGFDCACVLCSKPLQELRASDERRSEMEKLDKEIGDPTRTMLFPAASLKSCKSLLSLLKAEYGECGDARFAAAYYDAFQVCVAQDDRARAGVFAEYAYDVRVICAGEDCPETQRMKALMKDPSIHPSCAALSRRWKTATGARPGGDVGKAAFEKWLWRE